MQQQGQGHGLPQGQGQVPTAVPPASRKYILSLQEAPIVSDDLLEESNKECVVCLEVQKIGGLAVKLPCGHLFHRRCVTDWLCLHCTCPLCRFEVESNDATYEVERLKRMRERKLRMRADEIAHRSISQLRELCRSLNVSILGCIDKTEIVDRLKSSGRIEITEGAPPAVVHRFAFNGKSVAELRHMLKSYGLSDEGALEKRELRQRLEESGRIVITETEVDAEEETVSDVMSTDVSGGMSGSASSGAFPVNGSTNGSSSSSSTTTTTTASTTSSSSKFELSRSLLQSLPLRELKSILSGYGIDTKRCVERRDLEDLLSQDSRFEITD